ncbi:hypothetical protein ACLB2K_024328 [Fragaria x ananassa]
MVIFSSWGVRAHTLHERWRLRFVLVVAGTTVLLRHLFHLKSCHRNWQHAGEVVVVEVENTEVSEVGELRRELAVEDVVGEVEEAERAERRESGSSREDLRERRER